MADETSEEAALADEPLDQRIARVTADWDPIMGERPAFRAPKSLAERYDVLFAEQGQEIPAQRVYALALALAWPKLRRVLQSAGIVYKGDPAKFGGRVFEYLIGSGAAGLSEILRWGKAAITVIAGDELPGLELTASSEDAVGNSPGTED